MNIKKLTRKLNDLFGAPVGDLTESQERMAEIIGRLEEKKAGIVERMQAAGGEDETSMAYGQLQQEYKVVSKLLKKARKKFHSESDQSFDEDADSPPSDS